MVAKRVQVSSDGGTTWYTLPGNSGEFRNEAGELTDTIFGQNFASSEVGLTAGTITANSLYKGFAGYNCDLMKGSGVSNTFTGEAMTLVTGKTYIIGDATKDMWDHTSAITVLDNGVDKTNRVQSIDYLFGKITFEGTYTVAGPVTVTGKYFTKSTIAKGRTFNLTLTMSPINDTVFETAQANTGRNTYSYGLKTVALEVGGVYASSNGWQTQLDGRGFILIEIAPVGNSGSESRARGIFKVARRQQSGDVGNLEEETVNFVLNVPQSQDNPTVGFVTDLYLTPFRWQHPAASKLSAAVQRVLNAWEAESALKARYLPDGTTGFSGDVVIAECSITGGLEAMNEFSVNMNISGAVTAV
jgi:hypothetical protein